MTDAPWRRAAAPRREVDPRQFTTPRPPEGLGGVLDERRVVVVDGDRQARLAVMDLTVGGAGATGHDAVLVPPATQPWRGQVTTDTAADVLVVHHRPGYGLAER